MPKTIVKEYVVYNFEELTESAKEKAYQKWYEGEEYFSTDDNVNTLNKFANIFPIKIKNWEYDYSHGDVDFVMTCDDEIENLCGIRLAKYIYNNFYDYITKGKYYSKGKYVDGKYEYKFRYSKVIMENCCPLTGYYTDDVILEPIFKFLKTMDSSITFYDLMKYCLDAWVSACVKDYEYTFSEERFNEDMIENEYLFYEDGRIAN